MALGSHLITVRRLEKYINDVIGKKANLPDTSKTIIGNISQINSDLTWKNITGLSISCNTTTSAETRYVNLDLIGATELEIHFSDSSMVIPIVCRPNDVGVGNLNTTVPTSGGKFTGDNFWNYNIRARFLSNTGELYIAFLFQGASRSNSETITSINYR